MCDSCNNWFQNSYLSCYFKYIFSNQQKAICWDIIPLLQRIRHFSGFASEYFVPSLVKFDDVLEKSLVRFYYYVGEGVCPLFEQTCMNFLHQKCFCRIGFVKIGRWFWKSYQWVLLCRWSSLALHTRCHTLIFIVFMFLLNFHSVTYKA